jgi:GNAT superfamily N-acetyltransferase
MSEPAVIIGSAQADEAAWHKLGRGTELGENSFIAWLRNQPIARFSLHQMGSVVAVSDFAIAAAQTATHGPILLQQIIALARKRGTMVTVEYPAEYSLLFLNAYFKQNTRTRMALSLADYQHPAVRLPDGINLRHPTPGDEAALIEHVYASYIGSADHDMVCSDVAQAAVVVHDTLANTYCEFDWDSSFLAVDEAGSMVGNALLGNISAVAPGTALLTNISILPGWQGKGLGRALMANTLNAAKAHGYHTARLLITIGNWPAHALYRSFGFIEQGPVRYEAAIKIL